MQVDSTRMSIKHFSSFPSNTLNPRLSCTVSMTRPLSSSLFQTVPICRLGLRDPFLLPTDFVFSLKLLEKEAVSAIMCGLSVLELCLVIAMKHIQDISDDQPFNFEMVYSGELLWHGHSCTLTPNTVTPS